jgi:hypothetical protein
MLRGDKNIPVSWDLPKPMFNVFKQLHNMTDIKLACTGGTTGNGVNAAATLSADSSSMQILVYNHIDGAEGNSSSNDKVNLTVNNIPFSTSGKVAVQTWVVDRTHSNSFRAWQNMGSPTVPSQDQWNQLRAAGDLTRTDSTVANLTNNTFTKTFLANIYSTTLIALKDPDGAPVPAETPVAEAPLRRSVALAFSGDGFTVTAPGAFTVGLYGLNGQLVWKSGGIDAAHFVFPLVNAGRGATYVLCIELSGAASTILRRQVTLF